MRVAIAEAAEATVFKQGFENCEPEERFAYLLEAIFQEIQEIYQEQKIALVCGIISGNGDNKIQENVETLISWRQRIQKTLGEKEIELPTLTSPFIFTEIIYEKVGAFAMDRRKREFLFQEFYRAFLKSGIVSHIFVTPGYEESEGTLDEIRTASEEGVEIVFVNEAALIGQLEIN